MNFIWKGKVENGKLKLDHRDEFSLSLLEFEGKKVDLILQEHKYSRSHRQNRYYWGVLIKAVASEIGLSDKDCHEVMKAEFNTKKFTYTVKGKVHHKEVVLSTTGLSTSEFEEYQSRIRIWASEFLGVYIPLPNEFY